MIVTTQTSVDIAGCSKGAMCPYKQFHKMDFDRKVFVNIDRLIILNVSKK